MAVVTKAYTTTIVAGLTANASNVRRALDDLYDEFNGGINSANISSGFTLDASMVVLNDTAGSFTATQVEDAIIELNNQFDTIKTLISGSVVQDFTTIKNVGVALQQYAGHRFTTEEPGTTSTELLALYVFADSASKGTDEVGAYALEVCNADVVSGVMGLSGGALLFTSATSDYAKADGLLNSMTSGYAIDFWIKPEQITATVLSYIFDKNNSAADHRIYCNINNTGSILFTHAPGAAYTITAPNYFITGTGNAWTYIVCSQDSSNGIRLFINGELVASDISATNSLNSGSDSGFFIGSAYCASNPFSGYIGNFRVRQKVISQKDVDIGYASKYSFVTEYANIDYSMKAKIKLSNDDDYERPYNFEDIVVQQNSAVMYRAGGILTGLNSADSLKLTGKVN